MINSVDDLLVDINSWLRDKGIDRQIDPDTDIIDSRIVDSLQFVSMVVHVESLGADTDIEALGVENFRTVRRIYETCFVSAGYPV
ncbi:hypothetical protein [Pseudonocardia spinosispora]|uniref:hypothetical protein n=1 Tax=Pseudonocardia spinosispora TaxID=103441 RepID=UPI0012EB19DD|nr:hypothetical protein [Pseudonocardia spinosispora]